jgi:hypothetical protein
VRWLGTDDVAENRGEARPGRLTRGRQRWGRRQTMGGVFFYSRALRGGNTGLRKEGERVVMSQCGGRATGVHADEARRSSDIVVAPALRGGDAKGVCTYAIGEEVSWTGGGWRWPCGVHGHASAWYLCGVG